MSLRLASLLALSELSILNLARPAGFRPPACRSVATAAKPSNRGLEPLAINAVGKSGALVFTKRKFSHGQTSGEPKRLKREGSHDGNE